MLAEYRLGDFQNVQAYVANWNNEADEPGGIGISKTHQFYLQLVNPDA